MTARKLDEKNWRSPVRSSDRRHYRWHLLVEYLCNVRGLRFEDLLNAGVTEESAWDEMIAWYSSLDAGYSILDLSRRNQ